MRGRRTSKDRKKANRRLTPESNWPERGHPLQGKRRKGKVNSHANP